MKDSTLLSIQRDLTSATGWRAPQHVAAPQTIDGIIIGAIDVSVSIDYLMIYSNKH